MENNLGALVRDLEQNFISGTTKISKHVDVSLNENIERIEAYLNSKHTTGEYDSMGREKPFFNIVRAAVNVWFRATDIDRKDIMIKPTKESDTVGALLLSVHLHNWMRQSNFGVFLNNFGITLARYGSAVSKWVETDDELVAEVVPWNRLIVDTVDMNSAPVIEKLYLTPAQLVKRKGYDQEVVKELLETKKSRETTSKDKKDNQSDFIEIYEVHGELPLSYLTDKEEDQDTYVQQMHVLSFQAKKQGRKTEYDDFCLYKGKEKKNPYHLSHLIPEDGRTMSVGAVEGLFDSQWMVNHTAKAIKDQLDLASKLIFQTSDGSFVGQNAINAIETGDILVHAENKPLTQLANSSHDITSLQNFAIQWKSLGNEINGVSESMLGNNPPSGTAWRQTEALLQESHSLFEIMTENKGLAIEEMIREYVLPYLRKKMDTKDEIVLTLSDMDITNIESRYVKNQAIKLNNKLIKDAVLSGQIAEQPDLAQLENDIKGGLQEQGNFRFFKPSDLNDKTWKEVLKDIEGDVEVVITNEQTDKQAMLTTLNTMLATLARLGGRPLSKDEKLVFNKILTEVGGISPLQLSQSEQPATGSQEPTPRGGQVGVADLAGLIPKENVK